MIRVVALPAPNFNLRTCDCSVSDLNFEYKLSTTDCAENST